jgi:hypothetical protein
MNEITGHSSRRGRDREALAREACEHILCAPYTTGGLARRLGISLPGAARLVARLRKSLAARGAELLSVRRGRSWHYEIREPADAAWSSFARLKGFVRAPLRPAAGKPDDVIYSGR